MAREINKLSARTVDTLTEPGRHSDGGGLYLSVTKTGARRWVFLYRWKGKPTEMGLGSGARGQVTLARARELANEARALLAKGVSPLLEKRANGSSEEIRTFGAAADAYIEAMSPQWRNAKHRAQWTMTLTRYAAPLRPLDVAAITTEDVVDVLKKLWKRTPETGERLRGRIEAVLDSAKAKGWRTGENPARWRGHLALILPKRPRLTRGHHAALPFGELPAFVKLLRRHDNVSALALEFCILTAARSGEVLGARWEEIDEAAAVWPVPAQRMKGGVEHRAPLSARALEILQSLKTVADGPFVFPGSKRDKPLSNMAMAMQLRRMKREDITVHGFRSSFRDWAWEATDYPHELAEQALAHALQNKVEAAYRRGDALEKRREMMTVWAQFCQAAIMKEAAGTVHRHRKLTVEVLFPAIGSRRFATQKAQDSPKRDARP
jgi:integrase